MSLPNGKDNISRQLSAAQFRLWDMHLYLDTHACNKEMETAQQKTAAEYRSLRDAYEAQYGPLSTASGSGEQWLKDPWPWDYVPKESER